MFVPVLKLGIETGEEPIHPMSAIWVLKTVCNKPCGNFVHAGLDEFTFRKSIHRATIVFQLLN